MITNVEITRVVLTKDVTRVVIIQRVAFDKRAVNTEKEL